MQLTVILGNHLFPEKFYSSATDIFMCEDIDLCTHFKYHKHKIIFFLASMRNYRDQLLANKKTVHYFELQKESHFFKKLKSVCSTKNINQIQVAEIEDKFFEKKFIQFCKQNDLKLTLLKTPMFMMCREDFKRYINSVKKPFMKSFYEKTRQDTGLLMNQKKPVGGKYSFDSENRKKIPKKFEVIKTPVVLKHDKNTEDIKQLVDHFFYDHPGKTEDFWMHTNRKGALETLDFFLHQKFESFGTFEDALDNRDPFLYHSVLSPYINIGFITPEEIVEKALRVEVPLNSKEGFIRQIIGWREFIRGIYQEYSEKQEKSNFFNHQKKLTKSWYTADTGIPPLDDAIKKTIKYGYNHHIERLMVISNMMLLCQIHPQQVHKWFMEMYVDSSDWVMGPNVYGMAQFSDGGLFATKPYIAGSNYIHKMGHYSKGAWNDIMDGLYWRFIEINRSFFSKNYRMNMMVKLLDKMDSKKKTKIFSAAEKFLNEHTKA